MRLLHDALEAIRGLDREAQEPGARKARLFSVLHFHSVSVAHFAS